MEDFLKALVQATAVQQETNHMQQAQTAKLFEVQQLLQMLITQQETNQLLFTQAEQTSWDTGVGQPDGVLKRWWARSQTHRLIIDIMPTS